MDFCAVFGGEAVVLQRKPLHFDEFLCLASKIPIHAKTSSLAFRKGCIFAVPAVSLLAQDMVFLARLRTTAMARVR